MRTVFVIASALALTACDPASGTPATDQASGAQPPATETPMEPAARPEVEVETFVRELYTQMFEDDLAPLDEANSELWTPEAWAAVEAAWARDPGAISVDPLCFCQDPTGMQAGEITAAFSGATAAEAVVELVRPDAPVQVTLRLNKIGDAWRIDDVLDPDGRSFRQALIAGEA